jgi:ribosome-associated protein
MELPGVRGYIGHGATASALERKEGSTLNTTSLHAAEAPVPLAAAGSGEPVGSATLPLVLGVLDDSKAEETVVIDLVGKTTLADSMIVTSGRSNRHVGSIADHVVEVLKEHGRKDVRVEGMPHCDWVLIDAGDVIVHVFRPEVRHFYNLEKMWGGDRPGERAAS